MAHTGGGGWAHQNGTGCSAGAGGGETGATMAAGTAAPSLACAGNGVGQSWALWVQKFWKVSLRESTACSKRGPAHSLPSTFFGQLPLLPWVNITPRVSLPFVFSDP